MVYAEIILLENFVLDALLCALSGRLLGKNVIKRALIAGAVGSTYALLCATSSVYSHIFFKLLTGGLLSLVCYSYKPHSLLKGFCAILAVALLNGGCVLVVSLGFGGTSMGGFINIENTAPLILGTFMGVLLTEYIARRRELPSEDIYSVTAKLGEYDVKLNALYDTGNNLVDLAGQGVIVADKLAVLAQTELKEPTDKKRSFYVDTIRGSDEIVGYYSEEINLSGGGKHFVVKGYIALGSVKGSYNAVLGRMLMYGGDISIPSCPTLHE